jgi:hypothetical protein
VWVPTGQVISDAAVVFATDRDAYLSLLSSNMHVLWWTVKGESTLETRLRYTPSDGFETFPQPKLTERMDRVGAELHALRQAVMSAQKFGLTKIYNFVHNHAETGDGIQRIREIHIEVDYAVAHAYGWTDFDLGHGFYDTRQGQRFTIDPAVQTDILDRLLELNFERYEEETRAGLHGKGKRRQVKTAPQQNQVIAGELFPPGGLLF